MPEPVSLLMLQFLDWVSSRRRSYAEAMDAWRTSCPRLSVWEDALVAGLIQVEAGGPTLAPVVTLTPRGRDVLDGSRPTAATRAEPAAAPDPEGR